MLRHRYANGSPKRRKAEGRHAETKGHRCSPEPHKPHGYNRSNRFGGQGHDVIHKHIPGGAWIKYEGIAGKLEATGFAVLRGPDWKDYKTGKVTKNEHENDYWNGGKGFDISRQAVSWYKAICIETKQLDYAYRGLDENGRKVKLPATKRATRKKEAQASGVSQKSSDRLGGEAP